MSSKSYHGQLRPEDLEREIWRLKDLLARHGIEDSAGDDFDDEDEDEEDSSEEPSRWDEPSALDSLDSYEPRRSAGMPGGRLDSGPGTAYPKDAARAYKRYARAVATGDVFGSDIARFAAGEKIKASTPLDRGRIAVSRFSRSRH
jgi:hypothetical protein